MHGFYHHSDNNLEVRENNLSFPELEPQDFADEGQRSPVKRGRLTREAKNPKRGQHGLEGDVTKEGGLKRPTSPFAGFGKGEPLEPIGKCDASVLHIMIDGEEVICPESDNEVFEGESPSYD